MNFVNSGILTFILPAVFVVLGLVLSSRQARAATWRIAAICAPAAALLVLLDVGLVPGMVIAVLAVLAFVIRRTDWLYLRDWNWFAAAAAAWIAGLVAVCAGPVGVASTEAAMLLIAIPVMAGFTAKAWIY